ncbi:methyltransferase [Zea mays]|uniref:16S rRNA (uracil(1498)-N(3))-methyltransferase n=2 Tax=Zea mays TaxID=4577 RepID=A0A1D6GI91_MAIZE|nr:methyltransferase [Zea mays]
MLSSAAFSSSPLLRGAPLRTRHLLLAPPARAHGGAASRARGGLPRFHAPSLPSSKFRGNISPVTEMDVTLQGEVIRIQGDEFWHMTRVLRLGVNDKVELFNGVGSLAEGFIHKVDKGGSGVELLEDARIIAPQGIQWHVFAAFGTLKGGRADWLIEKCTELGASSVTPLLTERCHTIAENRVDRLQRLVLAAVKQCQRIHEMSLKSPIQIRHLLPVVSQSKLAFLASAEAPPLFSVLPESSIEQSGLLIIGPEGGNANPELH